MFVLMMQGYPLSANLPEESGLGERFWYWRGMSGQAYIHSIYTPDTCPPVPGAVFVIVRNVCGVRTAVGAGRFGQDGLRPAQQGLVSSGDEVHVHLLAREASQAEHVLRDLVSTLEDATPLRQEPRAWSKPVQLELLAA